MPLVETSQPVMLSYHWPGTQNSMASPLHLLLSNQNPAGLQIHYHINLAIGALYRITMLSGVVCSIERPYYCPQYTLRQFQQSRLIDEAQVPKKKPTPHINIIILFIMQQFFLAMHGCSARQKYRWQQCDLNLPVGKQAQNGQNWRRHPHIQTRIKLRIDLRWLRFKLQMIGLVIKFVWVQHYSWAGICFLLATDMFAAYPYAHCNSAIAL